MEFSPFSQRAYRFRTCMGELTGNYKRKERQRQRETRSNWMIGKHTGRIPHQVLGGKVEMVKSQQIFHFAPPTFPSILCSKERVTCLVLTNGLWTGLTYVTSWGQQEEFCLPSLPQSLETVVGRTRHEAGDGRSSWRRPACKSAGAGPRAGQTASASFGEVDFEWKGSFFYFF